VIDNLPDADMPKLFGLPANIDRSSQIVVSNQIVNQLRVLRRSDIKIDGKFDRETVKQQFKPLWKLWEALKKVSFQPNSFIFSFSSLQFASF
jgi:dynein heavy chain 2